MRFGEYARAARITTPAVVLGVFDATGIGVVRDLAQVGVPVLGLDTNPRAIGFTSRYPARGVCPDPHHDEAAFVQTLLDIGKKLPQRAVLLPCQDDCVFACSRHADVLAEHFLQPYSSWPVMRSVASKEAQVEAARKAGVDVPATAFLHDESDLEEAARVVPFPALLKSSEHLALRRRHFGKVVHVPDAEDLGRQYRRVGDFGPLLLQEAIPGGHDALLTLLCYLDPDSRPLAMFTRRKLREHPRGGFGVARLGESVWLQDVADSGLRLLQEIGYHGVAGVEFKRDPRDGRLKLMEINARHEMWHGFASKLGVSVSVAAYLDAVGRPLAAPRQIDGPRYIWATRDVPESVVDVLQGRMSARQWLASLRRVEFDLMFSVRDPVPGVYQPALFASRALGRRLPGVRSRRRTTATQALPSAAAPGPQQKTRRGRARNTHAGDVADAPLDVDARWSVSEFRGRAGLQHLEADWRRLYAQIPLRTSFLSYDACLSHVDHLMPAPDQLRCLALEDGGRIRAICALQPRTDRPLGPTVRASGVLWHVHGPQADVLCPEDEARRALIPAVVAHLREKPEGRRLLLVGSAPRNSSLWEGLGRLSPHGYRVVPKECVKFLDCTMPFDEFRAALPKNFRHKRNTAANRLAKLDDVHFETVTREGDLDAAFATFLAVEASGWKGECGTGTAISCSAEKTAFFRDLAAGLSGDADYCEINALYAEGRCLAAAFCTRTGATYSCLKIGYDEAFSRVSPGQQLVEKMVERCCQDPDIERFDMVSDAGWVHGWRPDTVPLQIAYVAIGRWPVYPIVAGLLQLRFGPARSIARRLRGDLADRRSRSSRRSPRTA